MEQLVQTLRPNTLIDFCTEKAQWHLAKVVSYAPQTRILRVQYRDGHQLITKECSVDLERVAWLREHTTLRSDPVFSENLDWKQLADLVQDLSSQLRRLGTGQPHKTAQLLRGLLPSAVDGILSHTHWTASKHDLACAFFCKVLDRAIDWLKASSRLLGAPSGSDDEAVYKAWPELFNCVAEVLDTGNWTRTFHSVYTSAAAEFEEYLKDQDGLEAFYQAMAELPFEVVLAWPVPVLLKQAVPFVDAFEAQLAQLDESTLRRLDPSEFHKRLSSPVLELTGYLRYLDSQALECQVKGVDQLIEALNRESDLLGFFPLPIFIERVGQHTELLKRSTPILKHLAQHGSFTREALKQFWELRRNSGMAEQVYTALVACSEFLEGELLSLVEAETELDCAVIKFLYKLTKLSRSPKTVERGLGLLYSFAQDPIGTETGREQVKTALRCCKRLLNRQEVSNLHWHYADAALVCLRQHTSVPQGLALLELLYQKLATHDNQRILTSAKEALECVFADLQEYLGKACSVDLVDPFLDCVSGVYPHAYYIDSVFDFLRTLNIYHRLTIGRFDFLWEAFVLNPPCAADRTRFFQRLQELLLDQSILSEVFNTFFCSEALLYPQTCDEAGVECFYLLLIHVNTANGLIEQTAPATYRRVKPLPLAGFDILVEFYLTAESPRTRTAAAQALFKLLFKLKGRKKKVQVWGTFVHKCVVALRDASAAVQVLELLHEFLTFNLQVVPQPSGEQMIAVFRLEKLVYQVEVPTSATIGCLRKQAAALFNKAVHSVVLTLGRAKYDSLDDDVAVSALPCLDFTVDFTGKLSKVTVLKVITEQTSLVEDLVPFVNSENSFIAGKAWNVLALLPPAESVRRAVIGEWRNLTVFGQVYMCFVLQDFVTKQSAALKFVKNGGLSRLVANFVELHRNGSPLEYLWIATPLIERLHTITKTQPSTELVVPLLDSLHILQTSQEEAALLAFLSATRLLVTLHSAGPFSADITHYPRTEALLENCLIDPASTRASSILTQFLLDVTRYVPAFADILLSSFLNLLSMALTKPSEALWSLLVRLINEFGAHLSLPVRLFADALYTGHERHTGILDTLTVAVSKLKCTVDSRLVNFVINHCLFVPPSSGSRRSALALIKAILPIHTAFVLQELRRCFAHPRDNSVTSWSRATRWAARQQHTGLTNLGATCYINSTVQQLFHLPVLRSCVLQTPRKPDTSLLGQLQRTFRRLQAADSDFLDTAALCGAIKSYDGRPVDVREQMDAEEFFNMMIDQIENDAAPLLENVKGWTVTELVGDCSHQSETLEPFITLAVSVKGMRSLHSSLAAFTSKDRLQGTNAYECSECACKVSASRQVFFKHLPRCLFVALKRFEFDIENMQRLKVNDYFEFPIELDLNPYMQTETVPLYTLKGVVVHTGSAEIGHYYSFIRLGESWFEFNDSIVKKFDPTRLSEACFGSPEARASQPSAYLLVYEQVQEEVLSPSAEPEEEVTEEDQVYWTQKLGESLEFSDFILHLTSSDSPQVLQFTVEYFLIVLLRTTDVQTTATIANHLQDKFKTHPEIAKWTLETVLSHLREFFLECPVQEKRKVLLGVLRSALWVTDRRLFQQFLQRALNLLGEAKPHAYFGEYFELLYRIIELNPKVMRSTALPYKLVSHYFDVFPEYAVCKLPDVSDGLPPTYSSIVPLHNFQTDYSFLFACINRGLHLLDLVDLDKLKRLELVIPETDLNKVGNEAIAEIYAVLGRSDVTVTLRYLACLVQTLIRSRSSRPFFRQLSIILRVQDPMQDTRIDYAFKLLNEGLKLMPRSVQIDRARRLLRLCDKVPKAQKWILRNGDELKWFLKSLDTGEDSPSKALMKTLKTQLSKRPGIGSPQQEIGETMEAGTWVEVANNVRRIKYTVVQDLQGVLLVKHTESSQLCWIDPFSESVWVKGGPQLGRSTS